MRRFLILSPLVAALAACDGVGGSDFEYSEWNAWNGFGKGSSVTFHMKNDQMEMWMTTTLDDKSDKELTLKTKNKTKVGSMDATESDGGSRKVTKAAAADPSAKCPLCSKPASDHAKPKITKKDGDVAGKKVKLVEQEITSCKDQSKMTMSYSTDVPGWLVEMGVAPNKMSVSGFEAK